jgi:hypothetical protein
MRSMVEGFGAGFGGSGRNLVVRAIYPSTTLRVVPLPTRSARREDES